MIDGLNSEVADFAPDAGGFKASVPEPASWAMLLFGFGAAGVAAGRCPKRKGAAASPRPLASVGRISGT